MGLELFEVRFFFWEKFTKFDLALMEIIKNRSKVVYRLSVIFLTISLNNFVFVKRLMGTPLDWKFLTHDFFFSFGCEPREVPISKTDLVRSKTFRYDFLETREFLWVKTFIGIQVYFRDLFFVFVTINQKCALNWLCFKTPLRGDTQPQWKKSLHCVALSELFRMFFFIFRDWFFCRFSNLTYLP